MTTRNLAEESKSMTDHTAYATTYELLRNCSNHTSENPTGLPGPNQQFNYNFSLKLFIGRVLITEQVVRIPHTKMYEAWQVYKKKRMDLDAIAYNLSPKTPAEIAADMNASIERSAQDLMFDVEQAINTTKSIFRCHVDQLPSDIPTGVTLETEQQL